MGKTPEQDVERDFPNEIAKHRMTVLLDNDVHRHLECREPGTRNRMFTITTWPGELCISGDMGTFVFNRLHDMFQFFRSDRGRVNLGYWSEKLVGVDRNGYKEYSQTLFKQNVNERVKRHLESADLSKEQTAELWAQVRDDVLWHADAGEQAAIRAALDFEFDGDEVFTDFWEYSHKEYTYHFVWCCHAIVWAIQQWDARVPAEEPVNA